MAQLKNVLFLCTANSARSILAEGILATRGAGKFRAFSAGSQPRGIPNPVALEVLASHGHDISGLRSKSWDEFAGQDASGQDAPVMDFVFTVCDDAAGESCPFWPGQPMGAHWGIADPAAVTGTPVEIRTSFEHTYKLLDRRISLFTALPLESLDIVALKSRLKEIGASEGATNMARDA